MPDRAFLEVVAEGEVAGHLEERVVPGGDTPTFSMSSGADALLHAGGPRERRGRLAEEVRLERRHPGDGEQHASASWLISEADGTTVWPAFSKWSEEAAPDLVGLHGSSLTCDIGSWVIGSCVSGVRIAQARDRRRGAGGRSRSRGAQVTRSGAPTGGGRAACGAAAAGCGGGGAPGARGSIGAGGGPSSSGPTRITDAGGVVHQRPVAGPAVDRTLPDVGGEGADGIAQLGDRVGDVGRDRRRGHLGLQRLVGRLPWPAGCAWWRQRRGRYPRRSSRCASRSRHPLSGCTPWQSRLPGPLALREGYSPAPAPEATAQDLA